MLEIESVIDEYDNVELSQIIDRCIRGERTRAILKRRLIDRVLYEPLAEEFNISDRYAKTIVYKAQERLYKYLKKKDRE